MSKKLSIKELEQKIGGLTEALQRERADAMNIRRRADEERAQLGNMFKAMVIEQLLPALDNLELALKHAPKDLAGHDYVKGVQGVAKQFDKSLEALGVERIKTVGEHFDPHLHEAVHLEDGGGHPSTSSGQAASEIVSEELQAGYKIGDEIIRPAIVKVKKGKK